MTTPDEEASIASPYVDSGFFVLRSPLLPFDELLNWSSVPPGCLNGSGPNVTTDQEWSTICDWLRSRLQDLIDRPEIRHALYVASPSLEASIDGWKRDPFTKRGIQTERSLVRYFSRMASRPTPFGLFSACSVGTINPSGSTSICDLELAARSKYRVRASLDYKHLFDLCASLSQVPEISAALKYLPNITLCNTGSVWHYLETTPDGTLSKHTLVKIYANDVLNAVLKRAGEGGATKDELASCILAHTVGEPPPGDEVTAYIGELIRSQVLTPTLYPSVTGNDPLADLIDEVRPLSAKYAAKLEEIHAQIAQLSADSLNATPRAYQLIASNLPPPARGESSNQPLKVDMFKPLVRGEIDSSMLKGLLQSLTLLCRIGAEALKGHLLMDRFREKFRDRYGPSYVPLAEALNEDTGIGFDTDTDLNIGSASPARSKFQLAILRKVIEAARDNSQEIQLSVEDFSDAVSDRQCQLPDAFSLAVTLVRDPDHTELQILFHSGVGPSGITTLARFGGLDDGLDEHMRAHIAQEEALSPDSAFAEVVYLPDGRIGNILARPILRDYEIPCLGRSGVTSEWQIPVSDLLVTVANDDSIVLYSKSLNRRVIPRLSSAHTFSNSQWAPLYRFLCLTQYEPWRVVPVFDCGLLAGLPFLPRMRFGRVVLQLARWTISSDEMNELAQSKTRLDAFRAVQMLGNRRGLPRWVSLVEGGNSLPVDLANPLSVDALVHVLRRSRQAILEEVYPQWEGLTAKGPEGRYQHELVIPFVRKVTANQNSGQEAELSRRLQLGKECPRGTSLRVFSPGSEWLFFKVYASPSTVDDLLTKHVAGIVEAASRKGMIDLWFFVRYADPDSHLRVRFHCNAEPLRCELMSIFRQSVQELLEQGRVWKIELATYQREIERYGGLRGLEISEAVFCADSDAAVQILQLAEEGMDEASRAEMALLSADRLLKDFGVEFSGRLQIISRLQTDFGFNGAPGATSTSERWNTRLKALDQALNSDKEPPEKWVLLEQLLSLRSARLRSIIGKLQAFANSSPTFRLDDILCHHVHMVVNRVVREKPTEREADIYRWLTALYRSRIAREETRRQPLPGA